ncbi:MAG: MFS transporter [Anaerolineae bacterium]
MQENAQTDTSPSTNRLSRLTKLLYGVGDTGFSLTATLLGAYFAIFLTDVVGMAPSIAAAAIFIGRSWDYINDPLIGHISDRTRTRWGRRRPFLLFGAIPYALVFMLLWWRPPWTSDVALAVYYALAYVLFDAAATFVYMPYFALTPELTPDYDERTALTSYRMFFSILGSLISFTLPLVIVGSFTPQNAPRVMTMGVIFGVTAALAVLITFFGTREREVFMVQAQPSLKQSLRAARSNKVGSTHICGVKTALIPILTALLIKSGTPTLLLGAFWQSSGTKARRDPTNLRRPTKSFSLVWGFS